MTQTNGKSFPGAPPPPVTELTIEQSFKLRRLEDLLPEAEKADIKVGAAKLFADHGNGLVGSGRARGIRVSRGGRKIH